MAASDKASDDSLYPIAVLIDELKNEDIQVNSFMVWWAFSVLFFFSGVAFTNLQCTNDTI